MERLLQSTFCEELRKGQLLVLFPKDTTMFCSCSDWSNHQLSLWAGGAAAGVVSPVISPSPFGSDVEWRNCKGLAWWTKACSMWPARSGQNLLSGVENVTRGQQLKMTWIGRFWLDVRRCISLGRTLNSGTKPWLTWHSAGGSWALSGELDLRPPEVSSTQCFFDSVTEHEYSFHWLLFLIYVLSF